MPQDFLYHKISEKEKANIKKEAKAIMDSFSRKLSKISDKKLKEPLIERKQGERQELEKAKCLLMDENTFFDNAPNKDKKNKKIIGEKKSW
jgi:translation elongation factor P/translation initiation factor 5A